MMYSLIFAYLNIVVFCIVIIWMIFQAWINPIPNIYENRTATLVISSILGIILFSIVMYIDVKNELSSWLADKNYTPIITTIYASLLTLPTLFFLWKFRTHDVKEQIQKTKESIHTSIYLKAIEMLSTEGEEKRSYRLTGLRELIKLKEQNIFTKEVLETTVGADLSKMNLSNFNFKEFNLSGADLSGADLSGANLSGAKLFKTNLSGANLSGANLSGAKLSGAKLSGAKLFKTNLSGANLSGANLSGAKLSVANLSGADLSGANLSGADLSGANLSGADLSVANLSKAYLFQTKYNKTTKFQKGFNPDERGVQKIK